jgi:hypothetical protein
MYKGEIQTSKEGGLILAGADLASSARSRGASFPWVVHEGALLTLLCNMQRLALSFVYKSRELEVQLISIRKAENVWSSRWCWTSCGGGGGGGVLDN